MSNIKIRDWHDNGVRDGGLDDQEPVDLIRTLVPYDSIKY